MIAAICLVGCSGPTEDLTLAIEETNGKDIRLSSVFPGDWENYLVICPYDSDINERLGFTWSDAPEVELYESQQTLVLVSNKEVVRSIELPRSRFDFCSQVWRLEPGDSVLEFAKNGAGKWVTFPPE